MARVQKKIVVFGGSGFIGSHVVEELLNRGYYVVLFDATTFHTTHKNLKRISGDILNKEAVDTAVKGAWVVYNFAAIADLKTCQDNPAQTFTINTIGNINIVEACIKHKVYKYIYASSLYVCSDKGSFYRISKYASELCIQEYSRMYGLNYIILRYGSVYGPRADTRNGVYRFITQALENKKIVHRGKKDDTRAFVHVSDVAYLSVSVLARKYKKRVFLVMGPKKMRVEKVIELISRMVGGSGVEFVSGGDLNYNRTPHTYTFHRGEELKKKEHVDFEGSLQSLFEIIRRQKQK